MATFNVDSLDFVDDEEVRTGDSDEFATRYDSGNDRLEIEDLPNATAAHLPRDVGTDLVGGKVAETVSEGKALADDGTVYESIQVAVNNASSWVKVGPGSFDERVTISTADLSLVGCGTRTHIRGGIKVSAENTAVSNVQLSANIIDADAYFADADSPNADVTNVSVLSSPDDGIVVDGGESVVSGCTVEDVGGVGINAGGFRTTVAQNTVENAGSGGIVSSGFDNTGDCLFCYNRVFDIPADGMNIYAVDSVIQGNTVVGSRDMGIKAGFAGMIVANNRVVNSGEQDIGTVDSDILSVGNQTT